MASSFKRNGRLFEGVPAMRSRIMSSVLSKNNKTTEIALRMALIRNGLSGWKLRDKALPGKPDFIFRSERVAIFVDGCFWHGCPKCYRAPKANASFWRSKIKGNRGRDKKVTNELRKQGWIVLRFWECQLRQTGSITKKIQLALNRAAMAQTKAPNRETLRAAAHRGQAQR